MHFTMMFKTSYRVFLSIFFIFVFGQSVLAKGKNYAVLVGASHYPYLSEDRQLTGPKNDVTLVRDFLYTKGFDKSRVHVFADNLEGVLPPNRTAILSALNQVTGIVSEGDFVYLHFSGHGSQQPADKGVNADTEPDGLDEIFLPSDAGIWINEIGSVENAIVDDEFEEVINAIRSQGAFVWVVFDTCHAGTLARGKSDLGIRGRRIDPTELGIPVSAISIREKQDTQPADNLVLPLSSDTNIGGLVAFYAAQSHQITSEQPFYISAERQVQMGLFTHTLLSVLNTYPQSSYRQLGQQIHATYAMQHRRAPTPMFEGPSLDLPIFGQASLSNSKRQQWPVRRFGGELIVAAGHMHRLSHGSVLEVFPNATISPDERIGCVSVQNAGMLESQVIGYSFSMGEHGECPALTSNKLPKTAFAALLANPVDTFLNVMLTGDQTVLKDLSRVKKIVEAILSNDDTLPEIKLIDQGRADMRMVVNRQPSGNTRLWFTPPDGDWSNVGLDAAHSLAIPVSDEELTNSLTKTLLKIVQVTRIRRFLSLAVSPESLGQELEWHMREGKRSAEGRCKSRGLPQVIHSNEIPLFQDCSELSLIIKNSGKNPADITLLLIDSDYGITSLFPHKDKGDDNRLHPNDVLVIPPIYIDSRSSQGLEQIIVIAAISEHRQPQKIDFSFLAQKSLPSAKRGGTGTMADLLNAFNNIYYSARGDSAKKRPKSTLSISSFNWQTVP